jgi:hypothetical protein
MIKKAPYPKIILILSSFVLVFSSCKTTNQGTPITTPTPGKINNASEYKPTEKEYKETFEDIDKLIQEINAAVTRKDYSAWLKYLSEEYLDFYNKPENLKRISESPTLKAQKINLKSIQDYFSYVIVPSQMKTRLESIKFVDDSHIKAYGEIYNELAILYYLKKNNGVWKIAIW